jgi:hypothetical protein
MTKLTISDLLKSKQLLRASELKTQLEAKAQAQKDFEAAALEQSRNQRYQSPKPTGSVTQAYQRKPIDD